MTIAALERGIEIKNEMDNLKAILDNLDISYDRLEVRGVINGDPNTDYILITDCGKDTIDFNKLITDYVRSKYEELEKELEGL